jgi:hypothetical protein
MSDAAPRMPQVGRFGFAKEADKTIVQRDGGHSSMVEPQIVVLAVAGSSPVDHPVIDFRISNLEFRSRLDDAGRWRSSSSVAS